MPDKKLFIIINEDRFFLSHRKEIGLAAMKNGWNVTIIAKDTGRGNEIRELGLNYLDLPINPTGKNIREELGLYKFLANLFRENSDAIFHLVGLKNLLWGSLAAKFNKVKGVVKAVSGMGTLFTGDKPSKLSRIIFIILRLSRSRNVNNFYIFQNEDDKRLFLQNNLIKEGKYCLIKGSGVNLDDFYMTPIPDTIPQRVVFTGRMLRDKGVEDLVAAAELLRSRYQEKAQFILCGGLSTNPSALSEEQMNRLADGRYIVWMPYQKSVKDLLDSSSIFCFPSYREGFPKSVIEASAVGRPIVTYDSIGCKDTVIDGVNGFKVPLKNYEKLAEKIDYLLQNPAIAKEMGRESRRIAERDYDINDVVDTHLEIYRKLSN